MAKKVKVVAKPAPKAKVATAKSSSKGGGGGSEKKISGQLKVVQKSLEKAMKPTSEENAATQTLGNLTASKEMGLNKIKAEPQAMGFITGQSRELERSTEEKAVPLKVQIAALQARRQASINVATAKKGFIEGQMSRKATAVKSASDAEYNQLRNTKMKKQINKLNTGGSGSGKSDWEKVTVEKGPTGRVRSIVERNKKTGETRRNAVK